MPPERRGESPEEYFEMGKRFFFPSADGATDPELALKYFLLAAQAGHAPAQRLLGVTYLEGSVLPQDLPQARRWLTAAAEQNDPQAAFTLALMFAKGQGVPKRWDAAYRLLSRPGVIGLPEARELRRKLKDELLNLYPGLRDCLGQAELALRARLTPTQKRFIPPFWSSAREGDDQKEFDLLLDVNLGIRAEENAFAVLRDFQERYYRDMVALHQSPAPSPTEAPLR
ncbi:MAG: sel1 repeat family protein [Deltaproteobacteria bacterium]|jgi:hypothetical protein|nr:sel1 repeat family protein [Deltaproteobacteria bacterium]